MSRHHGGAAPAGGVSADHKPHSADHEPGMNHEPHSADPERYLLMAKPGVADESAIDLDEPHFVSYELLVNPLPMEPAAKSLLVS